MNMQRKPKNHRLLLKKENLHGIFSASMSPILEIQSGDTVSYEIPDAAWGIKENFHANGNKRQTVDSELELDKQGHCLMGPIALADARAGMTLVVKVKKLVPHNWGWTHAGGWSTQFNNRLNISKGRSKLLRWAVDTNTMTAKSEEGFEVSIDPFLGVMGMPPEDPGFHPTYPPRYCGGNIDCKELTVGSTIYLPISVDQALFSCGDGHARQGDGEVSGQALEVAMKEVELEFSLYKENLSFPRARIKDKWICFGFHPDLEEASFIALENAVSLLVDTYDIDKKTALALASVVVDLRVTQIVNGNKGVHAILRDSDLKRL